MSSENNQMTVPVYGSQVIVLLICWLKGAELLQTGNLYQNV